MLWQPASKVSRFRPITFVRSFVQSRPFIRVSEEALNYMVRRTPRDGMCVHASRALYDDGVCVFEMMNGGGERDRRISEKQNGVSSEG